MKLLLTIVLIFLWLDLQEDLKLPIIYYPKRIYEPLFAHNPIGLTSFKTGRYLKYSSKLDGYNDGMKFIKNCVNLKSYHYDSTTNLYQFLVKFTGFDNPKYRYFIYNKLNKTGDEKLYKINPDSLFKWLSWYENPKFRGFNKPSWSLKSYTGIAGWNTRKTPRG